LLRIDDNDGLSGQDFCETLWGVVFQIDSLGDRREWIQILKLRIIIPLGMNRNTSSRLYLMPIDRLDFDNISEADLIELLTTKVPEGLRIEYKQALYGNSDAEKREALNSGFTI
jgi:hypothetical protein